MSNNNVFEALVIPDVPKSLDNSQQYIYIPFVTDTTPGIATYDDNDFIINMGKVFLNMVPINALLAEKADKTTTVNGKSLSANISLDSADINVNDDDANPVTVYTKLNSLQTQLNNLPLNENPIGTMVGLTLPTDAQLNAFVQSKEGRTPVVNDVIMFLLQQPGTDEAYKYFYTKGNSWDSIFIPGVEKSSNGTPGLVQGTYGIGLTDNTVFDIVDGVIRGVYINRFGVHHNLKELIDFVLDRLAAIDNGTYIVPKSQNANNDGNGNNLVETYLDKVTGATKSWSDDRFMPKAYGQPYFYTSDGYSTRMPTGTEPQFSVTATPGTMVFDIERVLEYDNDFNSKMSYSSIIRPKFDTSNAILTFRLTTYAKRTIDTGWTTLAIEDSGTISLVAGEYARVDFSSTFASLESSVLDLEVGDKLRQTLEITSVSPSTNELLKIYCTENAPSLFILNTITNTINVNVINKPKKVSLADNDFTFDGEYYVSTITPLQHLQPVQETYLVWGQVIKAGNIYENEVLDYEVSDGNIIIKKSALQPIDIYIASGILSEVNDEQ